MSIKGNWRRHGSEVVIRWYQRFFPASRLAIAASPLNSVAPNEKKTSGTRVTRWYSSYRNNISLRTTANQNKTVGDWVLMRVVRGIFACGFVFAAIKRDILWQIVNNCPRDRVRETSRDRGCGSSVGREIRKDPNN